MYVRFQMIPLPLSPTAAGYEGFYAVEDVEGEI